MARRYPWAQPPSQAWAQGRSACPRHRLSPCAGPRGPRSPRSVIHALRRKPQALAGSIYRYELFPGTAYAEARRRLSLALPQKDACRRMVALLALAHDEACETELGRLIDQDLAAGRLPDARQLREGLQRHEPELPVPAGPWGPRSPTGDVPVALTALVSFDRLSAARP